MLHLEKSDLNICKFKQLKSDQIMGKVSFLSQIKKTAVGEDFDVVFTSKNAWETTFNHCEYEKPEFVDSKNFSASRRPRGYAHTLHGDGDKWEEEEGIGDLVAVLRLLEGKQFWERRTCNVPKFGISLIYCVVLILFVAWSGTMLF